MTTKLTTIILLPLLTLTACQTTTPYTGIPQTTRTTSGSIIGGLVGAGLGSLTGSGSTDRRQKAMLGAGIGALAGGLIGNYMDRQEAELRRQLAGSGVSVSRSGNNLVLNMPSDITFATDSARVEPDFGRTLNAVAIVLKKYNRTMVDVTGHTDSVGSSEYNYGLSERRAVAVADFLRSRGVVPQRLVVTGRGEDQPVASNNTARGRQLNRRVTIYLRPLQQ